MFPVFALWPLALIVALCGVTTHVIEADTTSTTATRLLAFIEARVTAGAAHAAETATGSDSDWSSALAGQLEVQRAFDPRPKPPLLAAGAPVGTFSRSQRHSHAATRGDAWRAAWRSAINFDPIDDLARLALTPPLGSLRARGTIARPVTPSVAAAAVPPVDATILVSQVTAPELSGGRPLQGGSRARPRVRRGGEAQDAITLAHIADAMGWPQDFVADLDSDGSVNLAHERIRPRGPVTGEPEERLAAWSLERNGERIEAFWFEPTKGQAAGYFDRDGHALGTSPVPAPCKYTRISSRFSASRLHPVLSKRRPHSGVDFAAPRGTPVIAVADGTVEYAGTQSEAGNAVRVRHDERLMSHYAHLHRFATGIKPGKQVRRGDVIGFVGSTGLASGPHLHLGISIDGRYVDPLAVRLARGGQLSAVDMAAFSLQLDRIDGAYARAGLYRSQGSAVAMADDH
jgi:murein DD-endopeptidase MepM/ murein hydrolase activator NlpD